MNPTQSYPATGEVIDGKYQIDRLLGEGGMGAVAKATHLLRRAPVALKFMSPNVVSVPGAVERFLNEGVAASQIESDNVVHVFDVGKLPNGSPYLVMEYMEGHDLAEVIQREGHPGIDVPRACYFIIQTLRGLQVAHEAGVIHRDMKPSNCFVVNKEGEADFVKLLDFGISKVGGKSASLTQTNSALGTPLYMSPEQARSPRDVDLRSDLYSVGVILYELLTGRTPFSSESGEFTEILFKLFTQDPPPIGSVRADLPPELAAVVHKALTRDPNERFSTAAEFALALAPFADARSERVLQRLRAHQPGRTSRKIAASSPPVAEPAAAFSNLAIGAVPARTNDMPGAPPRPSAETQKMMGQGPATEPLGQSPSHASQAFVPAGSRVVSAAEATAATQLGGAVARSVTLDHGKQTDLGATRDSPGAAPSLPDRRQSPLVYIVPAVLALVVCGAGIVKLTAKPAPSAPPEATALPPEPRATAAPTVVPSVATALAPTDALSIPDASIATVASATASPKKNPEPPPRATSAATGTGNVTGRPPRLGDLKIHE